MLVWLSGAAASAQDTVFTWTDDQGTVHFSNSAVPAEHATEATARVLRRQSLNNLVRQDQVSIPFVFADGDRTRRFVPAVLEGAARTREVLMLVDTGATITLIDEELAGELDVEHVRDATLTGVTGTAKAWIGRLHALRLGDEEIRNWQVMVGPQRGFLLLGMDVIEHLRLNVAQEGLRQD